MSLLYLSCGQKRPSVSTDINLAPFISITFTLKEKKVKLKRTKGNKPKTYSNNLGHDTDKEQDVFKVRLLLCS